MAAGGCGSVDCRFSPDGGSPFSGCSCLAELYPNARRVLTALAARVAALEAAATSETNPARIAEDLVKQAGMEPVAEEF